MALKRLEKEMIMKHRIIIHSMLIFIFKYRIIGLEKTNNNIATIELVIASIFIEFFMSCLTFPSFFVCRYSGINFEIGPARPRDVIPVRKTARLRDVETIPYSFGNKVFPRINQKRKLKKDVKPQFKDK